MSLNVKFFDSMDHLEPKCPKCEIVLQYGINTEFDEALDSHKCVKCGTILKE